MTRELPGGASGDAQELVDVVSAIWCDVLGLDEIDLDDDFFELGGHSMVAALATTRLQDALGSQIDVALIFEHPTIREVVAWLDDDDLAPAAMVSLTPVDRTRDLPLSYAQTRLWTPPDMVHDIPFFNVPCSYRLRGQLDVACLQRALDEIVARHEALRTTFPEKNGQPCQVIWPPSRLPLQLVDLRDEPDALAGAHAWVAAEARRSFDVHNGPLLRAALLTIDDNDHILALCMHHIISDGSSMKVFTEELDALYGAFRAGEPSPLAPLEFQYADFAAWNTEMLSEQTIAGHLDYWRAQLADVPLLEIPTDRPRSPNRPHASGQLRFAVAPATAARLRALAREENATLFMVLLAALHATLARTTGESDVTIGSPVANRNLAGAEKLIGFFVNTLVMRANCSDDPSFVELLRQVRRVAIDAYAHQDLPFDVLIEALQPHVPAGFNPLYQVHFQVVPMPMYATIGDVDAEFFESTSGAAPLDLFVHCFETAEGIEGWVEYAADLFDRDTIEFIVAQYLELLDRVATDPLQRIWAISLGPSAPDLGEADDTHLAPIDALMAEAAATRPQMWAITSRAHHVTYEALDAQWRTMAAESRRAGVGPGDRVALVSSSPEDCVAGVIAAAACSADVVVIDRNEPASWSQMVAERARVTHMIDGSSVTRQGQPLVTDDTNEHSCSVIMSALGSDGLPVPVRYRTEDLAARALGLQASFPLEARDRVLCNCAPTSHLVVAEVFWPLLAGAHVIAAPRDDDPEALALVLEHESITVAFLTPAQLAALLRTAVFRRLPRLRRVICTGDGAAPELAAAFVAQSEASLHFAYGSSATVGAVLFADVRGHAAQDARLVYNRCVPGVRARVVDRLGRPVPFDGVGRLEIEFGGKVHDAGAVARRRRRGIDILRAPEDVIDTRGRYVLLRGVESIALRHEAVADAGVVWREDAPGHHRLSLYVEPAPPPDATDDFGLAVARVAAWQSAFDAQPDTPSPTDLADVQSLAARVLDRRPSAVLDIGCGTGSLASRVAPHVDRYVAVDFSEAALDATRHAAANASQLELRHAEADDFLGIEPDSFDVVVARAVTPYFPDGAYLARVIEGAVNATRPGGIVAFTAVASMSSSADWTLERRLLVDHALFSSLPARLPCVTRVDIVETGETFDAVLHIGSGDTRAVSTDGMVNDPLAWASVWSARERIAADVAAFLRMQLPSPMVPDAVLVVEQVWRRADGRPDVLALPAPPGARPALPTVFRAPSTPTEELIAPVFAEKLGLDAIGVDDDFFDLGGHSLLALQVTASLQLLLDAELDPSMLFEAPTVAELATAIDALMAG